MGIQRKIDTQRSRNLLADDSEHHRPGGVRGSVVEPPRVRSGGWAASTFTRNAAAHANDGRLSDVNEKTFNWNLLREV